MKIYIVDDEKIAAIALQKLITDYCISKEYPLECSIFERANDALQATESSSIKPDIIFTDIRMPVMNGLDFTKNLKLLYPGTIIVIISGYSDFSYAQTALKYNVSDYLLKPIYRSQIYDCMDILCKRLRENSLGEQEALRLKNQAIFNQLVFNDKFDLKCLANTISLNTKVSYISMVFFHKSAEFTEDEKNLMLSKSQQDVIRVPIESPNHKDIFMLNLYYISNVTDINAMQKEYSNTIYSKLAECIDDNTFSITNSEIVPGNSSLQTLYLQCYYNNKEYLLTSPSRPVSNIKNEKNYISPYSAKMEYEILKSFDFGNPLLTKQLFKDALLNLTTRENVSLWSISDLFSLFVIILNKKIYQYNQQYSDNCCDYVTGTTITQFDTIESIEKYFDIQIDHIYSFLHSSKAEKSQDAVKIMLNYIHENFFLDITLYDIASNILYLHPSYLSRLFKAQLGISFSKYLLQHRLKVSKEMLTEYRTTSVSEIASLCGFSDCSYFVKQFRLYYNTTPNSYRNAQNSETENT